MTFPCPVPRRFLFEETACWMAAERGGGCTARKAPNPVTGKDNWRVYDIVDGALLCECGRMHVGKEGTT